MRVTELYMCTSTLYTILQPTLKTIQPETQRRVTLYQELKRYMYGSKKVVL